MTERAFAVLGMFDSARALLDAVPAIRARGFTRLEAYTPYPVHGLDTALGQRRSPLGGMVLVAGLLGAAAALGFQWWTSAVDYPIPTGGKALFSWQAFVPIMFEVMVLFATFTAGLGMLLLMNRLPFFGHPVLSSKAIAATTRDRFALAIEPDRSLPDLDAVREALMEAGASSVEVVAIPSASPPLSPRLALRVLLAIAASCLAAGYATYWAVKLFPVLPPMSHMQEQPRIGAQKASGFFRDGLAMRIPPSGTVARGAMPYPFEDPQEAGGLVNTLPRTEEVLRKGREAYNSRCTVCHGALGDGVHTLTAAYGARPADLHSQALRDAPDGAIYHVIMVGKNAMPSYAAAMTEEERWSVIHYVRALQRARNARDEDLR